MFTTILLYTALYFAVAIPVAILVGKGIKVGDSTS